ncbi:MAG: CIA30 family protein [Gammaproteobacteria bacterium]|nr:CIA30 family protein [Gammaproteobacteria bacterium]
MAAAQALLLDDFSDTDGVSVFGTRWQGFTDRVMGGRSEIQAGYRAHDGGHALYMQGPVRLENNGGFIQVRLPLATSGEGFDASAYAGVAITLRGSPGPYFLHIRNHETQRVWQYYRAVLEVDEQWQRLVVSFADFDSEHLRGALDTRQLRSLAIVAYGEAFEAELEIARLELVPAGTP